MVMISCTDESIGLFCLLAQLIALDALGDGGKAKHGSSGNGPYVIGEIIVAPTRRLPTNTDVS